MPLRSFGVRCHEYERNVVCNICSEYVSRHAYIIIIYIHTYIHAYIHGFTGHRRRRRVKTEKE